MAQSTEVTMNITAGPYLPTLRRTEAIPSAKVIKGKKTGDDALCYSKTVPADVKENRLYPLLESQG